MVISETCLNDSLHEYNDAYTYSYGHMYMFMLQ